MAKTDFYEILTQQHRTDGNVNAKSQQVLGFASLLYNYHKIISEAALSEQFPETVVTALDDHGQIVADPNGYPMSVVIPGKVV